MKKDYFKPVTCVLTTYGPVVMDTDSKGNMLTEDMESKQSVFSLYDDDDMNDLWGDDDDSSD